MRTKTAARGLLGAVASVLLIGSPAFAASARVQQPAAEATVSAPTPVRVSVSRALTDDVETVLVRLSQDGTSAAPGTEAARLTCLEGCDRTSTDQVWGGVTLDPATPGAFGSSTPLVNGTWHLQPAVGGGSFGAGNRVLVSYPGSAVSGLSAAGDGLDVALSWRRAPEPDVTGYRVERREGSGSWTNVARLGPFASSHRDTLPAAGDWSYRVITERPDGQGGTYTTPSITVDVAVEGEAPGDGDGGGAAEPGEDPSAGSGSDRSGTADGSSEPSADTAAGDGSRDGSTSSSRPGSGGGTAAGGSRSGRVAPPPPVRRTAGVDADADVPSVAAPRERYYGEDDEYAGDLDYSDASVVAGERPPDASGGPEHGVVRSAVQEFVVSRLNSRSILLPVAAGLLFVTLGLHIYRWMHAS